MLTVRALASKLPPPLVERLRPTAAALRRVVAGSQTGHATVNPAASPYRLWHGPPKAARQPSTHAELVADIISVQGYAPAYTTLQLELEGAALIPVCHRFPHPDTPTGEPGYFEVTVDHEMSAGSSRARLIIDDQPQPWHDLPDTPRPGPAATTALDACPACEGTDLRPVGVRQHLTMVTCQRCQLVMTSPRPDETQTLVRYSDRYFAEEYLPSQQMTPSLRAHIDRILDRAEPAKAVSAKLFELGVGGGNLAKRAAERGWHSHGTDVNPASVDHATSRGLNVWLENADHADSLGGTYGAVVSEMSLEHVRRPDHFCTLAAEALVPGGRLVIYTVSAEGESFEHAGMASPLVGPGEHLFLFSADSLVTLCERAGLRVDELWRNHTGDEIGIVATKRRDIANPALRALA